MNYYKHYMGDYARATAHLSILEHGAYRLLIDAYYSNEGPLPSEKTALYRICRAFDAAERKAVDVIVEQFFNDSGERIVHQRIDEELTKYETKRATNRAIAGEREKQRRARSGEPIPDTRNHIPDPNNQNPIPENLNISSGLPPDNAPSKAELKKQAKEILAFLNEKAGKRFEESDTNLDFIIARLKEPKTTPTHCRQVIAMKCREWVNDQAFKKYLRPATLFNKTKFASYKGELGATHD